jgi:hypothetical protein
MRQLRPSEAAMALPNPHLASMQAYLQRMQEWVPQGSKGKGKKDQGGGGNIFLGCLMDRW